MKRLILLVGVVWGCCMASSCGGKYGVGAFTEKLLSSLHLKKECVCLHYAEIRNMGEKEIKKRLVSRLRRQYWHKKSMGLLPQGERKFYDVIGPSILTLKDVEFFNGPAFGEVCAKATISLDPDVWKRYRPREYSLKRFCYNNPDLKMKQVPERVKDAALRCLITRDLPRYKDLPLWRMKKALVWARVENPLFDFNKGAICITYRAMLVPVLLQEEKKKAGFLYALSSQKEVRKKGDVYTLSLKGKNIGDTLSSSLGDYLVVQLGAEGKGIATLRKGGAMVHLHFPCGPNFEVEIKMFQNVDLRFGFFTRTFTPFIFRYDNYKKDKIEFSLVKKGNGPITTTISMGDNEITLTDFYIAANYNEYRFVKEGRLFKLFCNGRFISTFFTKGRDLQWVEIKLNPGDILYQALARPLKAHK